MNITYHVLNRVNIRASLKKTPYEILKQRKSNVSYFYVFECPSYIFKNGKEPLNKFDPWSDEGIFLGYSTHSKAFWVFNKKSLLMEELVHVTFDEHTPMQPISRDMDEEEIDRFGDLRISPEESSPPEPQPPILPREWRYSSSHPKDLIIGDPSQGVVTRRGAREEINHSAFLSRIESKNVDEALADEFWVLAMHEELNQFIRNDVWDLVPWPEDQHIIGTKWIFKNKIDESGEVIRNKARLVTQGYT